MFTKHVWIWSESLLPYWSPYPYPTENVFLVHSFPVTENFRFIPTQMDGICWMSVGQVKIAFLHESYACMHYGNCNTKDGVQIIRERLLK